MSTLILLSAAACLATLPTITNAHIAAFAKGMYCQNGSDPAHPNLNSNEPVNPLYQLPQSDWWFQRDRGCDAAPPPAGEFLELPAGGSFTVELANNQAFTSLSYGGSKTSEWPDGGVHPEDWNGNGRDPNGAEGCIPAEEGGYMHVQNETMAQGTAWAIAYESDLAKVQMEDLVVFSVLEHTPWKRLATYAVPSSLPACPPTGCTCAWLWVPRGCGQPNMYMQPFRCTVTSPSASSNSTASTGGKTLAQAQPPTYCADDTSKCVKGAKQMIVFNQAEGDNTGFDGARDGKWGSPAYNERNGFRSGAQEDIFVEGEDGGSGDDEEGEGSMSILPVTTTATTTADTAAETGADGGAGGDGGENTSVLENVAGTGVPTTPSVPASTNSFTTTLSGRIGKPTKFTCYAEG